MVKILKYTILFLLVCIAVESSVSDNVPSNLHDVETDPEMEKYLKEAIENFRENMRDGIDAINMPPLDPLDLRNLDINVNENLATMALKIKQISVRDLSSFVLHEIKADLESFYLKLKLTIPAVRSSGKYNLNGQLLKIFPLTGDGSFSINITDADLSGVGKLVNIEDKLQVEKMDLDISWNSLQIYLENFLGGGKFSEVIQRMLPNVGKNIFNNFKPQILSSVNKGLTNALNKELSKPEVQEIIGGMLKNSQQKKMLASLGLTV